MRSSLLGWHGAGEQDFFGELVMRGREHVAKHPLAKDVFELSTERDAFNECMNMFRVLCVIDEWVGYKLYGKGRFWLHQSNWEKMVMNATTFVMVRPGDADCPF